MTPRSGLGTSPSSVPRAIGTLNCHFHRSLENQVVREGERDLYIKLTYSVFRTDDAELLNNSASTSTASTSQGKDIKDKKKPRKWHLSTRI